MLKERQELIIVCDKTRISIGNYLKQLISVNNDGENIVGTKDGTVAVVWTEEQYKANKTNIDINQHILFIGTSKFIEDETKFIEMTFDKYGMRAGWLGKTALMYVNTKDKIILDKDIYEEFIEFGTKYKNDFEKKLHKDLKINRNILSALSFLNSSKLSYLIFSSPIFLTMETIAIKSFEKKVHEQQYMVLALVMYMDALQKFLEG